MSNKSSIEWLFQKLWDTPIDKLNWYAILEQAKAMHKQEIINAYTSGEHQQGFEDEAEQYYNETF
jgi:hypothetical protein